MSMGQSIAMKYLEALNALNDWATVSEWAHKVGEIYPDILKKANKEALAQKNETTGLREITARISSNISRGAYLGKIEMDESERPRKVKILSEEEAKTHEVNEIEEDLAPITRAQKIKASEENLTTIVLMCFNVPCFNVPYMNPTPSTSNYYSKTKKTKLPYIRPSI